MSWRGQEWGEEWGGSPTGQLCPSPTRHTTVTIKYPTRLTIGSTIGHQGHGEHCSILPNTCSFPVLLPSLLNAWAVTWWWNCFVGEVISPLVGGRLGCHGQYQHPALANRPDGQRCYVGCCCCCLEIWRIPTNVNTPA